MDHPGGAMRRKKAKHSWGRGHGESVLSALFQGKEGLPMSLFWTSGTRTSWHPTQEVGGSWTSLLGISLNLVPKEGCERGQSLQLQKCHRCNPLGQGSLRSAS
jgi:hypothetical protein